SIGKCDRIAPHHAYPATRGHYIVSSAPLQIPGRDPIGPCPAIVVDFVLARTDSAGIGSVVFNESTATKGVVPHYNPMPCPSIDTEHLLGQDLAIVKDVVFHEEGFRCPHRIWQCPGINPLVPHTTPRLMHDVDAITHAIVASRIDADSAGDIEKVVIE